MIRTLKYKPTIFKISDNALSALRHRQDDDITAFALESIRNNRAINTAFTKPKNFKESLKNLLSTKSQMTVILDEKQGNFFLNVIRNVGLLQFIGKDVKIDLNRIIDSKSSVDKALLESKRIILDQIKKYNKTKKFFKF